MQIHHYDPVTLLFAGSSAATPDPMELARSRAAHVADAAAQAHAAFALALQEGHDLEAANETLQQALADAEIAGDALEPSVWLIPANATDVPPPATRETEQIRWNGEDAWTIEPIPEPEPEPEPEPPTPEQVAAAARRDRDQRIEATQWMVDRHRDELEIENYGWTTLSAADYQALLTYRQDLRDVGAQPGFPAEITWPAPPAIPGLA